MILISSLAIIFPVVSFSISYCIIATKVEIAYCLSLERNVDFPKAIMVNVFSLAISIRTLFIIANAMTNF